MCEFLVWFLLCRGLLQPFDGRVKMYKAAFSRLQLPLTAGLSNTSFTTSLILFSTVTVQYISYKGAICFRGICDS